MSDQEESAARLRAARAYAGIEQSELARRLGVTTKTVLRREKAETSVKPADLRATGLACGVPAAFMVHGFGADDTAEVIERLARIEGLLLAREAEDVGRRAG